MTFGQNLKKRAGAFIGYDPQVAGAASTSEGLKKLTKNLPTKSVNYAKRLFPISHWVLHYNLTWLINDCIAGLTVGIILVPQSMAYARIAGLPPQFGLYSSFVGVLVYAIFGTSCDVSVGPVAVLSLITNQVITGVQSRAGGEAFSPEEIATALAFISGFVVLGIGLLRLGWLVEFVSAPAVSGFMTGSAISIASGQFASLMGYSSKFNTRAPTYQVIINSFRYLGSTKKDAAFGLSGIIFLYTVRGVFSRVEARTKNPIVKRIAFFITTLRVAFVIIFLTLFSWVYLRSKAPADYDISILGTVPSGFRDMGPPVISTTLLSLLGPQIPVAVIVLLLEHIAIAKSFGRAKNYKIDPNQELIAIGVTNTLGTLFGAFPSTGSFSRSAIQAKAGSRTPLTGMLVGVVVIVALYALTGAFFWIPNAALSAVIIAAVLDLIASPRQVYGFWKISPLEAMIWFAAVLVSVFSSIENGVYVSIGASAALLLYRIARPSGSFLGRVRLHPETDGTTEPLTYRDVYIPVRPDGMRNPLIKVEAPPPGVIIYRFDEAFLYLNASYYADIIVDYAKKHTRSGQDFTHSKAGDRPWNDPGPYSWAKPEPEIEGKLNHAQLEATKPILRAVVFDFSAVSNLDTTSVQNLVDLRRVLENYANGEVEFHFATLLSSWIKRALLAGGFGTGNPVIERALEIAPVVPGSELVPIPHNHDPDCHSRTFARKFPQSPPNGRVESQTVSVDSEDLEGQAPLPVPWDQSSLEGPLVSPLFARFHLDLASAVAAAVGQEGW